MKTLFVALLLLGSIQPVVLHASPIGNTNKIPAPPVKLPDEMLQFFLGTWTGEGEFANGKKIAATLQFKLTLDSSWLSSEHTDLPPNRFKAISMWGVDRQTGQFLAYTFDSFNGHRSFVSEGWKNNKLGLTTQEYYTGRGLMFQHFIYEKLDDKRFKMTYEASPDGITWKMVDYLVFTRQ